MAVSISIEEYEDHRDNYDGFCRACQEWTEGDVEPDARRYECPSCGKKAVYGAEEAVMEGFITIDD